MKSLGSVLLLISTVYSANIGIRSYHSEIGIPLATKLKQLESEVFLGKFGEGRIAGGTIIDISEIPYQAAVVIEIAPYATSLCGGTLISATRVLTAAICEFEGATYTVALGTNYAFYGGLRINVTNFIPHPGYSPDDPSYIHDIAVLHIPVLTFTNLIQPISLPNQEEISLDFAGQMAVTSGYGITNEDPSLNWNQVLRAVNVLVMTPAACGLFYGDTGSRDESICTSGTGGVGICSSDMGGPLAVDSNNRKILIGITSFGVGCGTTFPSGYVRITQYLSWILST